MKKQNIVLGLITLILGGLLMTACFYGFKHLYFFPYGDKWAMCAMFEIVIAIPTFYLSISFFNEKENESKSKR